jgi:RNA polymerase sigma-70 factor (ECF subfamily)
MRESYSLYEQEILLKQISEGDVKAFRILFDIYNKRLYAAALKITKSPYAAEEIVQEVFTNLWEGRAGLAHVNHPSAYIFTIAYHKTFRYLKMTASDADMLKALKYRMAGSHNETEEKLQLKETQALINNRIEELPPQRKLIYKLSRESGLNHQQIAEQLNISPLTVKKQIVLALRSIRSALADTAPLLALFLI